MSEMENCHVEPILKRATPLEQAQLTDGHLLIGGMGCPNCAARVRNSLLKLDGVVEAVIDHTTGLGLVSYNPTLVSGEDLVGAVQAAGSDGHHHYAGRLVEVEA